MHDGIHALVREDALALEPCEVGKRRVLRHHLAVIVERERDLQPGGVVRELPPPLLERARGEARIVLREHPIEEPQDRVLVAWPVGADQRGRAHDASRELMS
jgi:hypothetical protein